jgi:hypothetical protein
MANIPSLPITIVAKIVPGSLTTDTTYNNTTSMYDGYPYTFSVTLDEDNAQKGSFDLQFLIANLKLLQGDYTVNISSKLISHWKHNVQDVQYYIALENTSTFNQ